MIGVVQTGVPDRGYNVEDLERIRVGHVRNDMSKGDADIRKKHIELIKIEKRLRTGKPEMIAYWSKLVGERNVGDAIKMLEQEADAEIAQEAQAAAYAAVAKKK